MNSALGLNSDHQEASRFLDWFAHGSTKWIGLGILVLALATRLFHLGSQNLWYDEQLSVLVSQHELKDLPKALEVESNKPPLYFVLMHYWLKGGKSEFWIRLPGALFGALTCLLALALGNVFWGRQWGWIQGVALALAPLHVYYSQEARMYSLLGLCGTAAMLCTWLFCATRRPLYAVLYAIAATLTCYTFTYGIFLLPFSCLLSLAFRPRLPWKSLWTIWAANISAALLFGLWAPRLLESIQSGSGLSMSRGPVYQAAAYALLTVGFGTTFGATTEQLRGLGNRILVEQPLTSALLIGGMLLVALVTWLGCRTLWRTHRNAFFFAVIGLGAFWGGPVALNLLNSRIPNNPRYSLLAVVPFVVAASGLLISAFGTGRLRKGVALLFCTGVALSLGNQYFDRSYARDDVRAAANYLKALQPAPQNVLVCVDYLQISLGYYYDGPARILPLRVGANQSAEDALRPFQKELADGRPFGVVYGRPDHGDPRRLLLAWLKQRYRLKDEQGWTGVRFYLFEGMSP
jgi:hypothetical protein